MRGFGAVALLAAAMLGGCVEDEAAVPPAPAPAVAPVPRAPAPAVEPGNVAQGKKLVETHCAGCHAIGLTGASPYPAAPPFRTLHTKYDVEGLAEAFAEGILVYHKGAQQMPEFRFSPEDVDDLIAYLKSLEK
jgi:mono/diheme cytochrome c family protein